MSLNPRPSLGNGKLVNFYNTFLFSQILISLNETITKMLRWGPLRHWSRKLGTIKKLRFEEEKCTKVIIFNLLRDQQKSLLLFASSESQKKFWQFKSPGKIATKDKLLLIIGVNRFGMKTNCNWRILMKT